MPNQTEQLMVSEFLLCLGAGEVGSGEESPALRELNVWLADRIGLPELSMRPLRPMERPGHRLAPMYGMGWGEVPLLDLLEVIATRPWRRPGHVQLLVREGEGCLRLLSGVKGMVSARMAAAGGCRRWWKAGGEE